MNLLDEVETEIGNGIIVGFPADRVEVRYPDQGRILRIWPRDKVKVVTNQTEDDVPRSKGGRPLSGAALAKHRAKQQ